MLQRGAGGGHQHPRTLRRALQLLPGRALGGGEGGLHTLGVGGAVDQGAGTLQVGLHPASAARLGAAGTNMLGYMEMVSTSISHYRPLLASLTASGLSL